VTSGLLVLNFGTFVETNRFVQRAVAGKFVGTDVFAAHPPGGLVKRRGMRVKKAGGVTTYSFHGLTGATWKQRAYRQRFERWMTQVLASDIRCVYLTGHHGTRFMWWKNQDDIDDAFWASYSKPGRLRFGYDRDPGKRVDLAASSLQKRCLLVVGFGCNIASPKHSTHYQAYFGSGARKPVVLGWTSTMFVPRSKMPSVNEAFFDHLETFAATSKRSVPRRDRLAWFYANEPMELVRAWGVATARYRERGSHQRRLWDQARARAADGTYYRFEYSKTTKKVTPVKA
jgi:hypothetical protein